LIGILLELNFKMMKFTLTLLIAAAAAAGDIKDGAICKTTDSDPCQTTASCCA
jgi:hypothetical protein